MKRFPALLGALAVLAVGTPAQAIAPDDSSYSSTRVTGADSPTAATSGLEGLFALVEEQEFSASVVLTTQDGVRSLEVARPSSLKRVLAQDREVLAEFRDGRGRPVKPTTRVQDGKTILLFGEQYKSNFEKIELAPVEEEIPSDTLLEGERAVIAKGQPGVALKTVVSVTTANQRTAGEAPRVETTELITVVTPPLPRKILVGTGEEVILPPEGLTSNEDLSLAVPVVAPSLFGELQFPVSGPVTSPFGMRVHPITGIYKLHDGTDFSASCGTPILAAKSGVVSAASYTTGYGNRVDVDHGNGFMTSYTHLTSFNVEVGDVVNKRSILGLVGSTGYSTGCHLHFMTIQDGEPLDPMTFFN